MNLISIILVCCVTALCACNDPDRRSLVIRMSGIYSPSKLELYEHAPDSMGRIVMVDCFLCNKFLMLNPSDSISLCSDIASLGACENTDISEVVFYYPYACDTAGKTVDFFKMRAGLAGCDLKTSASFHPLCKQ